LFWTTDINTELPIKLRHEGGGSEPPITLCEFLLKSVQKQQDRVAYYQERNGVYIRNSWNNLYKDACSFAKACH